MLLNSDQFYIFYENQMILWLFSANFIIFLYFFVII